MTEQGKAPAARTAPLSERRPEHQLEIALRLLSAEIEQDTEGVRSAELRRPRGMTNPFETMMQVGRELRFVTSEEHRRRVGLCLPYCARLATWFTSEIRARIDVELADYVRHADRFLRDDLESVAWALGKSVQYADTAEGVETIRALECFLIEQLWAADAELGRPYDPEPAPSDSKG